jgi:hypothetical protein
MDRPGKELSGLRMQAVASETVLSGAFAHRMAWSFTVGHGKERLPLLGRATAG